MKTPKYLNLGVLAHVDAGKTSLTERLLYAADVIDAIGSAGSGSTHRDRFAFIADRPTACDGLLLRTTMYYS